MASAFTCPRCFYDGPIRDDAKYCPRCGLADPHAAAADASPVDLIVGGRTYRVQDRIAIGSICMLYRCRFNAGPREVQGILKIARDPVANARVQNEAKILRHLHSVADAARFAPFLPAVEASVAVGGDSTEPARQASVLRFDEQIASPDELYSLTEVKSEYPAGLDCRAMAWIWRRLLNVLGFAHANGVVHGAVLPMHVLIEPRDHKLVLIDWCSATRDTDGAATPPPLVVGGHLAWYKRQFNSTRPPTRSLDIAFGARCMIDLIGGDPLAADVPPSVEPAVQRHLQRCIGAGPGNRLNAWELLEDFDRLIEALWGPRQFTPLAMPPRLKA